MINKINKQNPKITASSEPAKLTILQSLKDVQICTSQETS